MSYFPAKRSSTDTLATKHTSHEDPLDLAVTITTVAQGCAAGQRVGFIGDKHAPEGSRISLGQPVKLDLAFLIPVIRTI